MRKSRTSKTRRLRSGPEDPGFSVSRRDSGGNNEISMAAIDRNGGCVFTRVGAACGRHGKSGNYASKDVAVNSPLAPGALGEAAPAAPTPAPAPQARVGTRSGDTPRVELFGGYSFWRGVPFSDGNRIAWMHGGSASVAYNLNNWLGLVFDFGGFRVTRSGPGGTPAGGTVSADGNVFTYLLGPRISFRHDRFTPFVQGLFGAASASQVTLSGCTVGCTSLSGDSTFAMTAGGGLDFKVSRHFAIRLAQAEYLMTRFPDPSSNTENRVTENNVRLSAGLVFRFGGHDETSVSAAAACSVEPAEVFAGEPVRGTATGSHFNSKRAVQYNGVAPG